jgi:molybdate transport system regulatory protein
MSAARLSIRIDLAGEIRIGPGKIALLEAIGTTGSISAAARSLGISYRRAWVLVEEINHCLREPAVTTEIGGRRGGGAAITTVGEHLVQLYHAIEFRARTAAELRELGTLMRHKKAVRARLS